MLFCNLNNKIQTNSHTLVNSFRGKIKTKLSLTNQSPLYVDVTSQTKSVCFILVQFQQSEEKFRLCEDMLLV